MMHQAEKQSEKPMKELLQEQSEELKTYIDLKHKEMEELIAESEGRLVRADSGKEQTLVLFLFVVVLNKKKTR